MDPEGCQGEPPIRKTRRSARTPWACGRNRKATLARAHCPLVSLDYYSVREHNSRWARGHFFVSCSGTPLQSSRSESPVQATLVWHIGTRVVSTEATLNTSTRSPAAELHPGSWTMPVHSWLSHLKAALYKGRSVGCTGPFSPGILIEKSLNSRKEKAAAAPLLRFRYLEVRSRLPISSSSQNRPSPSPPAIHPSSGSPSNAADLQICSARGSF